MKSGDPVERCRFFAARTLLLFALISAWGPIFPSIVVAQPAPPVAVDNTDDALTSSDDDQRAEPEVNRLYVPAEQLETVLQRDSRSVLLSRDGFRRLWHAAKDADASEMKPPAAVVVSSADYGSRVDGERLAISAEFRFTQFASSWHMLRIPLGGLSIQRAELNGRPAIASRDPEDIETLLVFSDSPGEHVLSLELRAAITPLGSDGVAEFELPKAPTGTLRLTLPDDKSLLVNGRSVGRSAADGEAPDYRIPIGGRSRIALRITNGDASQSVDKLLFAKTDYRLFAAPGEVTWTATTGLTVFGRTLDQLTFTVPTSLDVAAARSNGLASWDMNDSADGERTEITLTWRQPFSGNRSVTIRGMFVPDDDEWSVPTLLLEGTDSHVAGIHVAYDPAIRLQPSSDESVRPVTVAKSDDPQAAARPQMAFTSLSADFDLSFFTPRKVGVMQVAMTNLLHISDGGLDLASILDVQADVAPLFEIRLTLPAEYEVTAATVAGQSSNWTVSNGEVGAIEIHIPLPAPLPPGKSQRIEIAAHADPEDWPVAGDPALLAFPQIGLPQADMIEARYGITSTDDLDVTTVDVAGLDPARGDEAASLRGLVESLGRELRLGFTYQDSAFSGELEVSRRPATFAVSTLLLSRLEPQRIVTLLESTVTVEGGGLEGLLIQLPESISDDTRFELASLVAAQDRSGPFVKTNIIEQTVSEAVNGRRTWALRFDRRLHGTHRLSAVLTQPRGDGDSVTLEVPAFTGADRQSGWIAVEARDDQRLTVTATSAAGQPLRSVDPIDLPGMATSEPGEQRIVAGYRFVRPGATAAVTEELFTRASVPAAVADRVDVHSLWGPTGQLQHRFSAKFRAVGVQSLSLMLPENAELWAVEADGWPIEVRESPAGFQIPLPQADVPEAERTLDVFYSTQADDHQNEGRLQQTEPRLFIQQGGGPMQSMDVLARNWTLLYPRDVVLLESDGRFAPTTDLRDDTILGRITDSLRVPTAASVFWRAFAALMTLIMVWLVYLVLRGTRRAYLTLLGGVAALAVLFVGVLVYSFTAQEQSNATGFVFSETLEAPAMSQSSQAEPRVPSRSSGSPSASGIGGGALMGQAGEPQEAGRQFHFEGGASEEFNRNGIPVEQALPPASRSDFSEPQIAQQSTPAAPPTPMAGRDSDGMQDAAESLGLPVQEVESLGGVRGALLSLSLDLDAPQGLREMPFRSLGTAGDPEKSALDVRFASRSRREVIAWIVAVGVMLAMWWLRAANVVMRVVVAVLVVIAPLALITMIPSARSMIVEGVFIGGMAGLLLWGLRSFITVCCHSITTASTSKSVKKAAIVGVMIAVSTTVGSHDSIAGETAAPDVPTIIVPYEGGNPLASDRVLLPKELFDRLRARAHPDELPDDPAPVDGVIAEAVYSVDATAELEETDEASSIAVTARYTVFNLRNDPIVLSLPLKDVAVTGATLDGTTATVRSNEESGIELIVPEAGSHVLDLSFKIPAKLRANSGEFALSLLPVATGRLSVILPPRDNWRVTASRESGTPITYRRQQGDDGRLTVEIPIDRGGHITVAWQPEQSSNARQGIVNVESTTAVQIDDAGATLLAEYRVEVRQGALSEIEFDFPQSLRLKRLSGPDVGGWELNGEADQRTLTIFLRRSVDDQTRILAELFVTDTTAADEISFDVPQFAPRDITRESGQVVLLSDDQRDMRIGETNGLTRTNVLDGELPEELNPQSLPIRGTFRFSTRSWQLSLTVGLRPPQMRVTAEHGMYLGTRKILLGSRMEFELSGAPRRLLRVLLPHDFLLVDLSSDDVAEWFVEAGELVLDLGQPRIGRVGVTFEGHVPRYPDEPEVVLETPLPQDLQRQETELAVWVEDGLTLALDRFEGWRSIAPEELSSDLRALHEPPPQFAFRSSELEPELIIAQVNRDQPQLVGDAVSLIAVTDTSVDYGLTLRWTIERSAVGELVFTTPDWLEGRLELTGEGIRRTSSEFTDDGRIRWTVSLDRPVRGQYLLSAIATLPPPEDGVVTAPGIRFEQPTSEDEFTELALQRTYAVLVNLSASQLAPVEGESYEKVLPDNLPLSLRDELVVQAMDIVKVPNGGTVEWQTQTVTEQLTSAATVTSADLTTVLAADGSWRTEVDYRVRNRGQQYLAVRIPAEARLLSATVKERPTQVLRTQLNEEPVALVPLPQTSAADLSFVVQLVLQGMLPHDFSRDLSFRGEQITLPVPSIVTQRESPDYGVPVVSTNWTVAVPKDFEATIVNDRDASNVSQQGEDGIGMMPYLQQLKELSDLNRLVSNKSISLSQRKRAAANIRDLATQIEKSTEYYRQKSYGKSPLGVTKELGEIAQQQDELLSESRQNAAQLESAITSGVSSPGDPFEGSTNGRQYIAGNSITILQDNQFEGSSSSEKAPESKFAFDRSLRESQLGRSKGQKAANGPARSRSMLKEQLSRQSDLQGLHDESGAASSPFGSQSTVPLFGQTPLRNSPRGGIGGGVPGDGMLLRDHLQNQNGMAAGFDVQAIPRFADAGTGKRSTGGLSLPIDIPVDGHTLEFSKLGGSPKLTLSFRPRESVTTGLKWLWTIVWGAVAAMGLRLVFSGGSRANWTLLVAIGCTALGLFFLLLLPTPIAWLGLPILIVGCFVGLRRSCDPRRPGVPV